MQHAILFEGNPEIISMPQFKKQAEEFYTFLHQYFEKHKVHFERIPPLGQHRLDEVVPKNCSILIGHSKGASWIVSRFEEKWYPNVEFVILFDPSLEHCDGWNDLELNKVMILSKDHIKGGEKMVEKLLDCVVLEKADHYFEGFFKEIEKQLDLVLGFRKQ